MSGGSGMSGGGNVGNGILGGGCGGGRRIVAIDCLVFIFGFETADAADLSG